MDLSAVIVSTNEAHFLGPCLRALRQGVEGIESELLLVDNHCTDDTVSVTRAAFPEARIVHNSAKYGFARSNNRAFEQARGRYFLLLNPDTEVRPGALPTLVRYLDQRQHVGIAGARLVNPDGTLQHSCRAFPSLRSVLFRWLPGCPESIRNRVLSDYLMLNWDHAAARPVDWLIGACLCVRRSAAEDVGFMDEGFRLYYEDIDWCYRMWRGGWEVHYVPEAVVMHHYQRSSARRLFSRALWTHVYSVLRFSAKHRLLRL